MLAPIERSILTCSLFRILHLGVHYYDVGTGWPGLFTSLSPCVWALTVRVGHDATHHPFVSRRIRDGVSRP